jgi:signal transduction histidine kinase
MRTPRTNPRTRRALVYLGVPALLASITWADYATGYELGFFVFYFAPVALAAWYGGRTAGLAFAFAAAAGWYASDLLSHHPYSNALLIYWETFIRLVSYLVTAGTLSRIRADLRRREELLEVISHDLRSPLGLVVGQAQLLRKRARADAFVSARVEAILRSASRMNTMIDDLLDSARKASHQLRLELEPLDVGAYLSELVERCAPVLDVQRIRLVREERTPLVARADPGRLERIVLNLVQNALKYSPPESPVELGASAADGWIAIRVVDQGPGIAPADLPHVFERFYRAERTSARGGLGLGLYSVRLLVEAHRGTVEARSDTAGGTTFVVRLPAEAREAGRPGGATAGTAARSR